MSDTIEKCPHDAEHPFTMVSNALIRDNSVSLECRMLIIYLLSNTKGWVIKIPVLCKMLKEQMCKQKLYRILNEAIEAGYIKRDEWKEKGLKKFKYYVSESPKFKKLLTHPEKQDLVEQDLVKWDSKNNNKSLSGFKEEQEKKIPPTPRVEEKKPPEKKWAPKPLNPKNLEMITKFQMTYNHLILNNIVYIGQYHIEFLTLPEGRCYYDQEHEPFKNMLKNNLRKLKIAPEGLEC